MLSYNSAKDVPHFCKWGLGQITGGEHISRLARREASAIGKMPQRKVCLWQTLIEGIIKKTKRDCLPPLRRQTIPFSCKFNQKSDSLFSFHRYSAVCSDSPCSNPCGRPSPSSSAPSYCDCRRNISPSAESIHCSGCLSQRRLSTMPGFV